MQAKNDTIAMSLVKVLLRAVLIATVLFAFITSAAAKGPVSATLTGPGLDRPLELVDGANRDLVVRFMEQTGLWYGTGDLPRRLEVPPDELGPGHTLTWVNGGPPNKSVEERTIRQVLYLNAKNGPVIHTPPQDALANWGPGVIGWFTAPTGLRDTLVELDVSVSAIMRSGSSTDADMVFPVPNTTKAVWLFGILVVALSVGLSGVLVARLVAGPGSTSSKINSTDHCRDSRVQLP